MRSLDEALAEVSQPKGRVMRVTQILDAIGGDDAERLRAMMADRSNTSYRMAQILTAMGHEVSNTPVDNWRDRHCPGWRGGL